MWQFMNIDGSYWLFGSILVLILLVILLIFFKMTLREDVKTALKVLFLGFIAFMAIKIIIAIFSWMGFWPSLLVIILIINIMLILAIDIIISIVGEQVAEEIRELLNTVEQLLRSVLKWLVFLTIFIFIFDLIYSHSGLIISLIVLFIIPYTILSLIVKFREEIIITIAGAWLAGEIKGMMIASWFFLQSSPGVAFVLMSLVSLTSVEIPNLAVNDLITIQIRGANNSMTLQLTKLSIFLIEVIFNWGVVSIVRKIYNFLKELIIEQHLSIR